MVMVTLSYASTGLTRYTSARAGVAASCETSELGFASTLALLSRFKQLMAKDNMAVDSQRMLKDSCYALEQLALGHTSTDAPLRLCAMQVFALFHE
jgi:hypothetical protein